MARWTSFNSRLSRVTKSSVACKPRLFIADAGLNLGDTFLGGLAFAANMICLLLQGATVENFPLQRGLVRSRLAA